MPLDFEIRSVFVLRAKKVKKNKMNKIYKFKKITFLRSLITHGD